VQSGVRRSNNSEGDKGDSGFVIIRSISLYGDGQGGGG